MKPKRNLNKLNSYDQKSILNTYLKMHKCNMPVCFLCICRQLANLFLMAVHFLNLDSSHMVGGLVTPGRHVRGQGTRLPWHTVRPTAGLLLGISTNLPCWHLMFQAPGWALPFALHRLGRQAGRKAQLGIVKQ